MQKGEGTGKSAMLVAMVVQGVSVYVGQVGGPGVGGAVGDGVV